MYSYPRSTSIRIVRRRLSNDHLSGLKSSVHPAHNPSSEASISSNSPCFSDGISSNIISSTSNKEISKTISKVRYSISDEPTRTYYFHVVFRELYSNLVLLDLFHLYYPLLHKYILLIINKVFLSIHHHHQQQRHNQTIQVFSSGVQRFVPIINAVLPQSVLSHPMLIVKMIQF